MMTFVEISFKNAHTRIFHLYMLHLRWCPIYTLHKKKFEITCRVTWVTIFGWKFRVYNVEFIILLSPESDGRGQICNKTSNIINLSLYMSKNSWLLTASAFYWNWNSWTTRAYGLISNTPLPHFNFWQKLVCKQVSINLVYRISE